MLAYELILNLRIISHSSNGECFLTSSKRETCWKGFSSSGAIRKKRSTSNSIGMPAIKTVFQKQVLNILGKGG